MAEFVNKRSKKIELSRDDKIFYAVVNVVLTIITIIVLYPLVYVLSASFSSGKAILAGKVWLYPVDVSLEGYREVFKNQNIWIGYGNTIENLAPGNRFRIITFRLPRLSDGKLVTLTNSDIIENYTIQDYTSEFSSNQIGQGACVRNGLMLMPVGLGTKQHPSIFYVWDLRHHRLLNRIDWTAEVPYEFEDCDFHGHDLFIQTNGNGLYRVVKRRK